jgi:hypothetical protein
MAAAPVACSQLSPSPRTAHESSAATTGSADATAEPDTAGVERRPALNSHSENAVNAPIARPYGAIDGSPSSEAIPPR